MIRKISEEGIKSILYNAGNLFIQERLHTSKEPMEIIQARGLAIIPQIPKGVPLASVAISTSCKQQSPLKNEIIEKEIISKEVAKMTQDKEVSLMSEPAIQREIEEWLYRPTRGRHKNCSPTCILKKGEKKIEKVEQKIWNYFKSEKNIPTIQQLSTNLFSNKQFVKPLRDRLQEKLKDYKDYTVLFSIFIDGKKPLFHPLVREIFFKNVLGTGKEKMICACCGKEELCGYEAEIPCYTLREKVGYAPQLAPELAWRAFPLCRSCAATITIGWSLYFRREIADPRWSGKLARKVSAIDVPSGADRKRLFQIKTGKYDYFVLVRYPKENRPPAFFQVFPSATAGITRKNWKQHINQFYKMIPLDRASKKQFVKLDSNDFLSAVYSFLRLVAKDPETLQPIISSYYEKIQNDFLSALLSVGTPFYNPRVAEIAMRRFFSEVLLPKVRKTLGSNKAKINFCRLFYNLLVFECYFQKAKFKNQSKQITYRKEKMDEKSDLALILNCPAFDADFKKGAFLVGFLANKIAWITGSQDILKYLHGFRMNWKQFQKLFAQIQRRIIYYERKNKLSSRLRDALVLSTKYLSRVSKAPPQEILNYYVALGYAYGYCPREATPKPLNI